MTSLFHSPADKILVRILVGFFWFGGPLWWESATAYASPELDARAAKIEAVLDAALRKQPLVPKQLEAVCASPIPRRVLAKHPVIDLRLRLCAAKAAALLGNPRLAQARYISARDLTLALPAGSVPLELIAEAHFHLAAYAEERLRNYALCGRELGLGQLARYERGEWFALLDEVTKLYNEVVRVDATEWTLLALNRVVTLHDAYYRKFLLSPPASYRGVMLPSPFASDVLESAPVLDEELGPKRAAWPKEIGVLYEVLLARLQRDGLEPLPEELRSAKARANAFAELALPPSERAVNPWGSEWKAGLIRRIGVRFERLDASGTWIELSREQARVQLTAVLENEPIQSVHAAYALVALAESGSALDEDKVLGALAHPQSRMRLAGVIAAEAAPRTAYYEPLLKLWTHRESASTAPLVDGEAPAERTRRFASLQNALYGLPERILLALRALVDRERHLAMKLATDKRLPEQEKAWLLGELGDPHLLASYRQWAKHPESDVVATGLYGAYLAAGNRMFWLLQTKDTGNAGCVSRHLMAWERKRARTP